MTANMYGAHTASTITVKNHTFLSNDHKYKPDQKTPTPKRSLTSWTSRSRTSGRSVTPRMLSCRVVFLTSYFTAVVLLAGYSAFLISFLATRETKEFPFTSFRQFLVDGRYQLGMLSDSAFTFYFEVGINHYCVEITFILHLFTDFPYPFCTFISFPLFSLKAMNFCTFILQMAQFWA